MSPLSTSSPDQNTSEDALPVTPDTAGTHAAPSLLSRMKTTAHIAIALAGLTAAGCNPHESHARMEKQGDEIAARLTLSHCGIQPNYMTIADESTHWGVTHNGTIIGGLFPNADGSFTFTDNSGSHEKHDFADVAALDAYLATVAVRTEESVH